MRTQEASVKLSTTENGTTEFDDDGEAEGVVS